MIEIEQLWDLPIFRIIYDKEGASTVPEITGWCKENLTKSKIDEPLLFVGTQEQAVYIGLDSAEDVTAFKLRWM